ncbi:transposase [Niameybacter massiliensis]|uniref:Transposase n=1 Tax=Holtiella tumoricola TaxID=3018743 RepID=A0AA42J2B2_9FIRM|nr:transposase [Holtiella tumoricola]MDA3733504.1 transposase [Holtiella tumoricola]
MGRKAKFSSKQKLWAIDRILSGEDSILHTATLLGCSDVTIHDWLRNYQISGINGITVTSKNNIYTTNIKLKAVKDYLKGVGSLREICQKYSIRSTTQLRRWIIKYNSHEELKASGTGGVPIMTKGRKTTYDERVEIIQYCIEHQNNYAETADKYQVSYQQVYSWVKKYESKGIDGLVDKRGKNKTKDEMTELERLRAENKLLKAQNRRQELEMAFLKKLDEIERRRF